MTDDSISSVSLRPALCGLSDQSILSWSTQSDNAATASRLNAGDRTVGHPYGVANTCVYIVSEKTVCSFLANLVRSSSSAPCCWKNTKNTIIAYAYYTGNVLKAASVLMNAGSRLEWTPPASNKRRGFFCGPFGESCYKAALTTLPRSSSLDCGYGN